MAKAWEALHPEVRWYIEDVARQVRRRRWMGAAQRFGWIAFALTGAFTLTLWLTSATGVAGLVVAGIFVIAVLAGAAMCALPVLRNPVAAEQVALFIDERHPELESRVSTALDLAANDREGVSAWLTEKFLEESLERVRATSLADLLDPKPARSLGYAAAAMGLSSLILLYVSVGAWLPAFSLLVPGISVKTAALPFSVEPGDVRVRRGDNQMIWIRTTQSDREVILRWREPGAEWQEIPAHPSGTERVYYHEFSNVQQDIQYQVRYGHQRSKEFQITAWLPPDVSGIDLTYHYPDYLQQPSREVPNSGNIAAVEGSTVDVDVWTNKPVAKAEMVLDSGERLNLVRKDETRWQVPVTVTKDDAYRIELVDQQGEKNEYPSRYTIAMSRDRAPEVKIEFPRGDNEVSMLEEVPFNFNVSDDYGFQSFGVQFEVAGREPIRIPLGEGGKLVTTAKGSHELRLEDLGLEVGDFITWTVWAEDTKPGRSSYESMGDPFFLEVRPFKREYREALSGAGQGGAAGQDEGPDKVQKDILIATWNLRRESKFMDDTEFTEKRGTIVETQEKLLQSLSGPNSPLQGPEDEMKRLKDSMKNSLEALNRAALPDPKAALSDASVQQQNSLRGISRLKPRDAQVQQTKGGGAGGGGGERADISELEMARNRNFYEEENVTREQQQASDQVLNKIKELAQRQQNVNDEIAKLISELQTAKTDEERERLKKQLERLRDEMKSNLERLDKAQQDLNSNAMPNEQTRTAQESLDRARHQMNRSLELMDRDDLQQARAAGSRASEALDDIQQNLQNFSRDAATQRMRELQKQMQDLQQKQKDILAGAEDAQKLHTSPSMDDQKKLEEAQKQLAESKDKLAEDFSKMMNEASELASRGEQAQELMSHRLGDWMRETSKEGIYEDIQETKPLIQYGIWDNALAEERNIDDKLAKAGDKLDAVAGSLVGNDLEGMQKALESLDKLMQREEVARALDAQGDKQPGAGAQANQQDPQGKGPGEQKDDQKQPGSGAGEQKDGEPKPGEGGKQPSKDQQPGTEQGPGSQPGDQQASQKPGEGQQPGDQPSSGQQGNQPGKDGQPQQGQQSPGNPRGGQRMAGGRPQGGPDTGGGAQTGGGIGNFDPNRAMRDFAENGYEEWLENLRNAESLLPDGSPIRTEVMKLRERVEGMRREWRVRSLAPRFDLFLQMAAQPLADTTENLQREIERLLSNKEFLAEDEGDVPERYRQPVAEYFKRLSESEGSK